MWAKLLKYEACAVYFTICAFLLIQYYFATSFEQVH